MGPVGRIIIMTTVVGLSVAAYFYFEQVKANEKQEIEHKAKVTAQLWVATSKYRTDPEKYISYRDSLLTANNLTEDDIRQLTDEETDQSLQDVFFADRVNLYVDSLVSIEDSIRAASIADSLADSLTDSIAEPETRLDSAQVDLR